MNDSTLSQISPEIQPYFFHEFNQFDTEFKHLMPGKPPIKSMSIFTAFMQALHQSFISFQSTISNYDIRYISYCAQDPEDLAIFAYITKDAKTGKHYCHVFKAASLVGICLSLYKLHVIYDGSATPKHQEDFTEIKNNFRTLSYYYEYLNPEMLFVHIIMSYIFCTFYYTHCCHKKLRI